MAKLEGEARADIESFSLWNEYSELNNMKLKH